MAIRYPTRSCAVAFAIALVHIMLVHHTSHVDGFAPPTIPNSIRTVTAKSINQRSTRLCSTDNGKGSDGSSGNGVDNDTSPSSEAQRLKDKANQYRIEAEKLKLTLGLQKIDELERDIREFIKNASSENSSTTNTASTSEKRTKDKLQELKDRVESLVRGSLGKDEAEKMLSQLSSFSSSVSTTTGETNSSSSTSTLSSERKDSSSKNALSPEEVKNAIAFLETLPPPVKDTLAKAAGYPSYDSILDIDMEVFVQSLYEHKNESTETLRRLYYESFTEPTTTDTLDVLLSALINEERADNSTNTRAMELFPRTVQDADESILPTAEDANVVFQLLDRSFMATEKPIKGDGGYVIRGVNKRKTANELLDYVDGKIAKTNPEWTDKFQLSLVEIYSDASEELFEDALLITPNKFVPLASKLLSGVTTAVALFSSIVFCIDTFADNEIVMTRLKDASEIATAGGTYDLTWFNELLIPLLVTLGAAQGLHEAAHLLVAWTKQVKLTSPTVLPSQALPYLSFQNRIKTSPKGYSDLFDIAFVGPIAGLSVSFIALLVGLQMTTTVDSEMAQLLPSLPVGYLAQSSLAGTVVDLVLGGGDGILLNQDPTTQVPLHPVAIGGFIGLIIHALDLVPIGSTDGGRMSQAVLGRVWHLTFSSLVFLVLFITSFTSDSNILLGFLFIYSFTQRDMEIPCRNEIDKADLSRAVAALVSWLLAALILVPLR